MQSRQKRELFNVVCGMFLSVSSHLAGLLAVKVGPLIALVIVLMSTALLSAAARLFFKRQTSKKCKWNQGNALYQTWCFDHTAEYISHFPVSVN